MRAGGTQIPVKPYLNAAQVQSIPKQWSDSWFRRFITNYMNPAAMQDTQLNPVTLNWTLVGSAQAFGTSVQKTGADLCSGGVPTPPAWDSTAYIAGGAPSLSFAFSITLQTTGTDLSESAIGLSANPAASIGSLTTLPFGLHFLSGAVTCWESGVQITTFPSTTYMSTDVFTVKFDGINVSYLKNGTLLRSVASGAAILCPIVMLYYQGTQVTNITLSESTPSTAFVPCPVYGIVTTKTQITYPATNPAQWIQGQKIALPGAFSFEVIPNGTVDIEVYFENLGGVFGNGYMLQFAPGVGVVALELFQMNNGNFSLISTPTPGVPVNASTLTGSHNVTVTVDANRIWSLYLDGVLQGTANAVLSTGYLLSGQTFIGSDNGVGSTIMPPNSQQDMLDYIADGGTFQKSQRYFLQNNTSGNPWTHVGVLTLNAGSAATFIWHTGQNYNSNGQQQTTATVTVRGGGGGGGLPNLAGVNCVIQGNTNPLPYTQQQGGTSIANYSVVLNAYNGVTAAGTTQWDVYFNTGAFTSGPLDVVVSTANGDAFQFDGSPHTGSLPWTNNGFMGATTQWLLQPSAGDGTDGARDGSTYIRMPSPPAVSAAGSTSLNQSGTSTTINVGSSTFYLGNKTVTLNSGSVNPGAYGTYYVYADSPNWSGGAVAYIATTNNLALSQSPWRFLVGTITTVSGGGGTGGGGHSPCFSGDTRVLTAAGYRRFDELPEEFEVYNHTGRHRAKLLVHRDSIEPMRRMGAHLVTQGHLILVGDSWVPAERLFHEHAPQMPRTVYNMHVLSNDERDMHYILENGLTAHNIKE